MLFNTNDSGTVLGALIQSSNNYNKKLQAQTILNSYKDNKDLLLTDNFDFYRPQFDKDVVDRLEEIRDKAKDAGRTGEQAFEDMQKEMNKVSNSGTKLGKTFANIGKTIVNGLASMAISAAISALVIGLKWLWDNKLTDNAKIEKQLKAISNANEKLDKSVSDLSSSENELSGVESQINKINTEISSIQSKGTLTFTDQGEIDKLTRTKQLLEAQQRILEQNIKLGRESAAINAKSVLETGYTGKSYSMDNTGSVTAGKEVNASYKEWYEMYKTDYMSQGYNQYVRAIREGNSKDQIKWKEVVNQNTVEITEYVKTLYEVLASFQDSEGNIIAGYEDIYEEYVGYINNLQSMIDPNNFNQLMMDWSDDKDLNYDFTAGFTKVIKDMYGMETFDFGELKALNEDFFVKLQEQGIDETTLVAILNYKRAIYESTLKGINDKYNPNNLPQLGGTYWDSEGNIHKVQEGDTEWEKFQEDTNNAQSSYEALTTYVNSHPLEPGIENITEQYNHLKDIVSDWSDKYLEELTPEERQLSLEIVPDTGTINFAELKKELSEKMSPVDVAIDAKISAVDAVDSMADAKTAITSLEELWNQTVKNSLSLGKDKKYLDENGNVIKQLNDKNQAVGFADPAMINSVESAFYKFSEKLKKEGNDAAANEVNQALEEFEKTLTKFPGDADKAQQAIDNLITAYIDQTDIIKNLTEENAEWSIAQLKAYGITNAEEVVMSRLSSTTKQLAKQFSVATDALTKLTNAQEDNYDETAMGTVQEQLNSMFSTELNGETISPNFDATWIIENLELLQKAASGSTEAMWQLQQAAAKKIAANVDINLPDQNAINGELNYINNLIDSFDISDVEVGTSLDDTPMIQGLNNLVKAGVITRDSMNAILSGIGVEPKITYEDMNISMSSNADILKTLGTTAGLEYIKHKGTIGTVKVPKIGYEVTSKGVGAQYKAPSGSGSGSGGNGGSGGGNNGDKNKAKEESAESFDWIEVKIKRIEEEIARLDKSATNVYDSWTNRNKALREEMEKVTEQIKAQSVATKEYARNAELVSASGRMLTEKQNTQLEKGKKAWTDKLQQDIIDGKYTTKNKKGKKVLDTKKLKKKLGDSYSSYIKDAAQELFDLVQSNNKKKKKTKVQKNIIVDTPNKPKKSDYDDNKEFKDDLKAWKEAQTIWKSGKYQKKIREGTMTGKDIEDITNKYLVDAIKKETEIVQKEIDAKDKIQELRIELANLNKQELDDIIKKWDQLIELSEKQISLIDTYISRVETAGYWVTEKPYQDQRDILTQKEADAQQKYIDAVAKYEEWRKKELDKGGFDPQGEAARDAQAEIMEAYNGLQNIKNEIVEIDKKIRELPWERFDWLEEELEDIKNEAEALSELLTLDKTMNDFGYFNERGMANLAMLGVEYEETARKVQDYAKQREQLAKDLEADPLLAYNKDYLAEVDKINQGYRDSYKELGSILQNISSTFQESIDQNLSNLKKMMDEYKETLSAAKNLYDYQKNISNQTDNITKLRKQLLAYQGDDSEAGRKRRQELTNQLNAAEQQLQETEWDRYISQTGEMLDNLYADYEQLLNSKLENITALIGDLIYEVNNNPKLVAEGIESILKLFGIETNHFDSFTKNDGQKILSAINNGKLAEDNSKILEETKEQKQKLLDMIYALDTNSQVIKSLFDGDKTLSFDRETGALLVKDVSNELTKNKEGNGSGSDNKANSTVSVGKDAEPGTKGTVVSLVPGVEPQEVVISSPEYEAEARGYIAQIQKKESEIAMLRARGKRDTDKEVMNLRREIDELKTKLHSMNYPGYAKGSKSIPSNRWAWTQENGEELIFRRSDGAMLTPLGQGSMVFTNEMSKRLWEIASGNVPSILGDTKLPNINSNIHSNLTQNNTISISLPNVQDYESFKTALQNDTRFEKFVQEITIGQAMGNNTLNKRKY